MTIMAPRNENELRQMLKTAVLCGGPAAVRYPRSEGTGCPLDTDLKSLPVGKSEIIRDGTDLAIFTVGTMAEVALSAAEALEKQGVSAAVINARFIKPIDEECILSYVSKTGRIITCEENVLNGGFGSRVLELLNSSGIGGVKLTTMGLPDSFIEHGDRDFLLSKYGLTADEMVMNALNLMNLRHFHGRKISRLSGGYRVER
jgi:1-deoxy-D-xylulose-5-phosphate synthase